MNKERYHIFDIVRGIVVLLMVFAHSVYFYHNYTTPFLGYLEKTANFVCFVSFLLVSGAVSYLAYLKEDKPLDKGRIFKRLSVLVLAYYIIAIFVSSKEISAGYGLVKFKYIFDLISLRVMPPFMEYIPPFIIYSLLLVGASPVLKKIGRSFRLTLIFSLVFYALGYFGSHLSVPAYLLPWKSLLVGGEGVYRFPVVQYLPIYLIGLYWGYETAVTKNFHHKKYLLLEVSSLLLIFIALGITVSNLLNFDLNKLFLRWPPSPTFLFVGLAFSSLLSYLLYASRLLFKVRLLKDFLLLVGQNALAIFASHLIVLNFYNFAGGARVGSLFMFLIYFALTIIFSLALATFVPFNHKFNLDFIRRSKEDIEIFEADQSFVFGTDLQGEVREEYSKVKNFFFPKRGKFLKDKRVIKKRHILGGSLVALAASFIVVPSVGQQIDLNIKKTTATWWSDDFAYRRQITITNDSSFSDQSSGQGVKLTFDHASLVKSGKSEADGSDLVVVYWTGKKYLTSVITSLADKNSANTTLYLTLPEKISSGQKDSNYFLYYGNPVNAKKYSTGESVGVNKSFEYKFAREESFPYILQLDKKWYLTGYDDSVDLSVNTDNNQIVKAEAYLVDNEGSTELIQNSADTSSWSGSIKIKSLKPGPYKILAKLTDKDGNVYQTQRAGFNYSKPVYVSWTQDWEGYDASDNYLVAISQISDRFDLPITHFFNARIFLTNTISKDRADYLKNWVLERKNSSGDEIGMHIHMFYDLVSDAGVAQTAGPNWGDNGDGYGSLTTDYNQADMEKILDRSLAWFSQEGLGRPISYRAGGWFANTDTLKALASKGFLIDSSGRTRYQFGRNNATGPWNLTPTTQPYYPSVFDQNVAAEKQISTGILEMPDNGADSYWFSGEDMIARFKANYDGGVAEKETQVTFITHPHWFKKTEQEKINLLFSHIANYSYKTDNGPVIYTTLQDAYNTSWSKK